MHRWSGHATVRLGRRSLAIVACMTLVAVAVGVTVALRPVWSPTPSEDSVDAGFARDMARHHGQAVLMADIIRARTENEELRYLATDILLTQQAQIGQMGGWLDAWGLNRTRSGVPPMAWSGMSMGGEMPGMASRDEVASLRTLDVKAADIRFLNLMIAHHRGGVHMAQAALELDVTEPVRRLARAIVKSQSAEIDAMADMLRELSEAA